MKLYRYERGYISNGRTSIYLRSYEVIKETEKSYAIDWGGSKKMIRKTGKKRFAYPTSDEAYVNFQKRTTMCIAILDDQIKRAKAYLIADRPMEEINFK